MMKIVARSRRTIALAMAASALAIRVTLPVARDGPAIRPGSGTTDGQRRQLVANRIRELSRIEAVLLRVLGAVQDGGAREGANPLLGDLPVAGQR